MERLLRSFLTGLVTNGSLDVFTASGGHFRAGDGSGEPLTIRFTDTRAQWAFLLDPEMHFGELYMDGRLRVEQGSLYALLCLLMLNARQAPENRWLDLLDRLRFGLRRSKQRNDRQRSQRNVAHHYDLDAALYELFLDADKNYSCAYFEHPGQDLGAAQLAKKRHVTAKLCLQPGQRVLDIGCGWGGLALYLAQVADAGSVLGITLSAEQLAIARSRSEQSGLRERVEFRMQDYRELDGTFDRIVSVGMFEHVGLPFYDTYFQHCRRLLTDQGVMLLHTIGLSSPPAHADPWIDKYIFPGGYIPTLSEITPAVERAGLVITDIEILRLHYAETLRAWRERFMARREEALALRGERFCLMWEFFLAYCEAAFRHETLVVFQIQLATRNDTVPLKRDYIARAEEDLRNRERGGQFP
jgi:cyclopropane-fatty-acyl-phospholipid synthase